MDPFTSNDAFLTHGVTGTPLTFKNVVNKLGQQVSSASDVVLNKVNNPLLNVLFNKSARFQDQSGIVDLVPGMFGPALNMQGYGPDGVRAQIDIGNRSVSVGKGPFDATFGYGQAPIPRGEGYGPTGFVSSPDSYWGRLGFRFPAKDVPKPADQTESEQTPAALSPAQQFLEESLSTYMKKNPEWYRYQ